MASLSSDKVSGRRVIQFMGTDGVRRSIRLGKVPLKHALAIKLKVEHLVSCQITGCPPDDDLSRWIAALPQEMHSKLADVMLLPRRNQQQLLGNFLDEYIQKRDDLKPGTREHLQRTAKLLKESLGENRQLPDVTADDAEDFRRFLLRRGLGENTIRPPHSRRSYEPYTPPPKSVMECWQQLTKKAYSMVARKPFFTVSNC